MSAEYEAGKDVCALWGCTSASVEVLRESMSRMPRGRYSLSMAHAL